MKNLTLLILLAILLSCGSDKQDTGIAEIDQQELAHHIEVLASDEFEGRAPSSPGEQKTIEYLKSEFEILGLEPGNNESYLQEVPLIAITASPDVKMDITSNDGETLPLSYKEQMMVWTKRAQETISVENSELVFVGYGIVAPEFGWNDYEGIDVRGKTVVIIINDPGYVTGMDSVFNGKAMTYYGRWTYKYEEAARQGAAGAMIIHQTGPAGYPWEVVSGSWAGTQFDLVTEDKNMSRCAFEGWFAGDTAKRIFETTGLSFDELMDSATRSDFVAVPLQHSISLDLHNTVKQSISNNIIAKVSGTATPDEYIIYTAHWDHLGKDTTLSGDQIFNGALDNASGTAGLLELAQAFKASPPKRSVIFLAVTAEEKGLLGSAYYAIHPIYSLAKTVANINMDGLNIYGKMKDITIVGYGNSELDNYVKIAAEEQHRYIRPDPEPEKGYFYRSDHFSFARQGVPSLYTDMGINHETKGEEWTREQTDDYTAKRYHKPADEYDPNWDLSGAIQDLQLLYEVGSSLANDGKWPEWSEGVAFKTARDKQKR